ncbi:unnamed protein product [Blepharisma stoltei]|uniref:Uncharacterized protein n=1 Tax=Blepharisma stoltei TaxID=1481888 RepID=A0AAU9JE99_9CILI|nr:unnamed protein product [Blepharisma stoltei]
MFPAEFSNDPSKRNRGRPPKGPVKKIKREDDVCSNTEEVEDAKTNINQYDDMHREFIQFGMSQTSQLILRRIVQHPAVPSDRRCQPLLRLLLGTMQDLDLNEIETALWAIYLEKIGWADNEPSLHFLICYAAFAAKSYLNDDIRPYEAFLSGKIDNFQKNYEKFVNKYNVTLEVVSKDINKRFRELSRPILASKSPSIIDYNFYVDDILSLSPPYHSDSSKLIKELTENKEIMRVYKAYKNKEKIIVKKARKCKTKPLPEIPVLEKLDSVLSTIIEEPIRSESEGAENKKDSTVYVSPILFHRIDSLCNDYANNEFTPISSPPLLLKRNSLLNRLSNA